MTRTRQACALFAGAFLLLGIAACGRGSEKPPPPPPPPAPEARQAPAPPPDVRPAPAAAPEVRQRMAQIHLKMASCLLSERPISACRDEMLQTCQDMMGKDACPMLGGMGPGMMGREMMGGGMMQQRGSTPGQLSEERPGE